jgi:F-type H+-transporting ATPase subunit b
VLAVPLDEFILGLVAFFIVFGVLGKFALPKISQTLKDRADAIEGGIERAAQKEAEAQAVLDQYRERISHAHGEAADIRAKAEADAKQILADARSEAEAERAAIAARGEAQLAAERSQTLASLKQDVGGLAVDLASRVVGESLQDDARSQAVVDRFLTDLETTAAGDQH